MAKKKMQMKMTLSSEFLVKIPDGSRETFEKDLKRSEMSLNWEIAHGDSQTMGTIYADQFTSGGMSISKDKKDFVRVSLEGIVLKELDPKFDADLISCLESEKELAVTTDSIIDSEVNSYYVNGDESSRIKVGVVALAS